MRPCHLAITRPVPIPNRSDGSVEQHRSISSPRDEEIGPSPAQIPGRPPSSRVGAHCRPGSVRRWMSSADVRAESRVGVCVCVCAFFCLCPRRMDLCLVSMSGLTNLVGSKILYTQMELTYSGSTSLQVFDNWNKDQIIRSNTTKFGWARYILDASCLS